MSGKLFNAPRISVFSYLSIDAKIFFDRNINSSHFRIKTKIDR